MLTLKPGAQVMFIKNDPQHRFYNGMIRKDMLKRGDKIIMSGFGAGMTWGAVLMEW